MGRCDPAEYPRMKGWAKRDGAFPERTCPASRHTAMIADSLRDKQSPLRKLLLDAGYEPDHMAQSIESTCMSVWQHRRYLQWDSEARAWLPKDPTP